MRTHLFYLSIYSAVALVQLESLRAELERVQMGLALMTLSVQKLVDIVTAPPGGGCCSLLDFLLPLPAGTCTMYRVIHCMIVSKYCRRMNVLTMVVMTIGVHVC